MKVEKKQQINKIKIFIAFMMTFAVNKHTDVKIFTELMLNDRLNLQTKIEFFIHVYLL